jgi:hypothetical protein
MPLMRDGNQIVDANFLTRPGIKGLDARITAARAALPRGPAHAAPQCFSDRLRAEARLVRLLPSVRSLYAQYTIPPLIIEASLGTVPAGMERKSSTSAMIGLGSRARAAVGSSQPSYSRSISGLPSARKIMHISQSGTRGRWPSDLQDSGSRRRSSSLCCSPSTA